KLALAFGAALVLVIGLGGFSLLQLQTVNEVTRQIREVSIPKIDALRSIKRSITSHSLLPQRRIQTTDCRQLAETGTSMRDLEHSMETAVEDYRTVPHEALEQALIGEFLRAWSAYVRSYEEVRLQVEQGIVSGAISDFETDTMRWFEEASTVLDELSQV